MNELIGLAPEHAAMERFLVTGSEGCIGAWTVRNLVLAGCPTVAVDVTPEGRRLHKLLEPEHRGAVVHVAADLREQGTIERLVAEHGITRVIHLAALQVPFVAADPILGGEVNVVGTLRLLEAVRAAGDQVRGVVYASSTAATGPEGAVHEPQTLYGALKLCNEHTARIYARDYGTCAIGLRPCIVYGPARDQGLTAALTHALKAAVLGVPYEIPFGGTIDAQYTEDVAAAFIRTALVDGNDGARVYDLHGETTNVAEFVAAIDRQLPASAGLVSYRDEQIPGNVLVDDTDLVERLGSLPKTALDEGIRRSAEIFARLRDAGELSAAELPLAPA